jgi:hypothetical protein
MCEDLEMEDNVEERDQAEVSYCQLAVQQELEEHVLSLVY